MKSSPKKPAALSDAVKLALRARGKNQAWLASEVGVNFSTFRVHLKRNEFYQVEAEQMCTKLELPSDFSGYKFTALKGEPPLNVPREETLGSIFRTMDRQVGKIGDDCQEMRESYRQAMGKLGHKDLVIVFTATLTPLEMEQNKGGIELRKQIATSISNGATLIYVRPDQDTVRKYITLFEIRNAIPYYQQEIEFKDFRSDIGNHLSQMGFSGAAESIRNQVFQIYTGECPFLVPGLSLGLIRTFDHGHAVSRVSCRLTGNIIFVCTDHELTASRMVGVTTKILEKKPEGMSGEQRGRILKLLRDFHADDSALVVSRNSNVMIDDSDPGDHE